MVRVSKQVGVAGMNDRQRVLDVIHREERIYTARIAVAEWRSPSDTGVTRRRHMARAEAQFVAPDRYFYIEIFSDSLKADTLRRIAPDGEYCMNLVRRLPGGEKGDQAQELVAWCESRSKSVWQE